MSRIKYGIRYGPKGEWLDIVYETGEMSRFWEPVLGMVLVPVFGMALGTTQKAEMGSRGSGDGKFEEYCVEDIMWVNYCCVLFRWEWGWIYIGRGTWCRWWS